MLTDEDVTKRLCVTVTGTNNSGSKTLGCRGLTNEIFPANPKQTGPTTLAGSAYVGDTLVSGGGAWAYAGTRFARRWEACNAEGQSCEMRPGATASTYVVRAGDLGKRIRVRIVVESNQANKFPSPVEVFTPLSAAVTPPPPGDTVAPVISALSAVSSKLKPGGALALKVRLSEPGTLSVDSQRVCAGRKPGKAGARKGKKCTVITKVATVTLPAGAGATTVKLPKRKLAAGDYRAVVTPVDAAGNRGAARTVAFRVKR